MSTSRGLAMLPLPNLLRSTAIFHACSSASLVKAGSAAISLAVAKGSSMPRLLASPILATARATIFSQFVAGEGLRHARAIASQLAECNVRCIVDHSTEELEDDHLRQHNLDMKLELLRTLSSELSGACSFVPVKMTSLISPTLLERLTDGVERHAAASSVGAAAAGAAAGGSPLPPGLPTLDEAADAAELDGAHERTELTSAMARLRTLCDGARAVGVPLLLDAEQTHRQPAIRLIARTLSAEFNREGGAGAQPLVYDTHQAYLVGAEARLHDDLAHARASGYVLAVKLVRGAYRAGEMARDPTVLQPSKDHTDAAYDRCAALLLEAALGDGAEGAADDAKGAADGGAPLQQPTQQPTQQPPHGPAAASLLLATHNRQSALSVAEELRQRGAPSGHGRVHFAQILGMADDLTLSLGLAGCSAHKLVPYGSFDEILPWLLRRLEENQDALGACATERPLLRAELARRLAATFRGGGGRM